MANWGCEVSLVDPVDRDRWMGRWMDEIKELYDGSGGSSAKHQSGPVPTNHFGGFDSRSCPLKLLPSTRPSTTKRTKSEPHLIRYNHYPGIHDCLVPVLHVNGKGLYDGLNDILRREPLSSVQDGAMTDRLD